MDDSHVPTREEVKAAQPTLELLETKLAGLLEMAEDMRTRIALHKAWAAPVRRVPEDLLSMVFLECALDEWKSPLVLGAVCRRWRGVMLNTPRAWALVQITAKSPLLHPKLLDLWLSRCGALRLHISLPPLVPPATVATITRHTKTSNVFRFSTIQDVFDACSQN